MNNQSNSIDKKIKKEYLILTLYKKGRIFILQTKDFWKILEKNQPRQPTKVRLVKAMVFPVVMYGCESWTIKKAECGRINAFELWCWRRLLRVPWAARSNQSILKEISPKYSLEGLMLKLKLPYFGTWCEELTSCKRPWCWERSKAGGEGDDKGWDGWMASPIQWTWVWVNCGSWWWQGGLVCYSPWGRKELDTTEQLNWTEESRHNRWGSVMGCQVPWEILYFLFIFSCCGNPLRGFWVPLLATAPKPAWYPWLYLCILHNRLTVGDGAVQSLGPAAQPWDRKGVWTGCRIVLEPRYLCSNLFPLTN